MFTKQTNFLQTEETPAKSSKAGFFIENNFITSKSLFRFHPLLQFVVNNYRICLKIKQECGNSQPFAEIKIKKNGFLFSKSNLQK